MCDDDFPCIFDHFFTGRRSDGSEVGPITCYVGWGTPGQRESRDYIKELKLLRKRVDWSVEKKRHSFYRRLVDLIYDWQGGKPDLRTIFSRDEIEWLLTEDARNEAEPNILRRFAFMHFVATISDYRDAPDLGEDGRPQLGRATPLHRAAVERRDIECIYYLLQIYDKFDANYVDEAGLTHFHVVCMTGFKWHAERFLEHGQDPDCPGYATGDSPLHLALAHGKNEVAELLLRSGADASSTNAEGLTPLHLICMKNDDDVLLKTLFEISEEKHRSVLIDAPDKWGWTPLHHALACGCKKQIVDALLRRGADCNLANKDGSTPLHLICERKYDDDLMRIFFEINDDIRRTVQLDAVDKFGRTPLQVAVANLLPDAVEFLLSRGSNLSDFVFPDETYFGARYRRNGKDLIGHESKVASDALLIVDRLKKRGHELNRSGALSIMQFFLHLEKIVKDNPDKKVGGKKSCPMCAANNKAAKQLCSAHRFAKLLKEFFQSWTVRFFLTLTDRRLPVPCCRKIIGMLSNDEVLMMCTATELK